LQAELQASFSPKGKISEANVRLILDELSNAKDLQMFKMREEIIESLYKLSLIAFNYRAME
jgi:hypothetical protein